MCGKRRNLFSLNCIGERKIKAKVEKDIKNKSKPSSTSDRRETKGTVPRPPPLHLFSLPSLLPGFPVAGEGLPTTRCALPTLPSPAQPAPLPPRTSIPKGWSLPIPPLPVRKEEARDTGTPVQLSSSKTQQVIPGERRQGRSARALTPENQSIVTWREFPATAGPAPPPVLGRPQSAGLWAGVRGDSRRRRRRAPGAGGGGGEGRPGRRGPAAKLVQYRGFFLRELLAVG